MREILFRGKPVVPGKYNGGSFAFGYYCCSPSGKHYIELSDTNGCKSPVEVNPDTVGQYTGLKDKHGKRIFEGDMIKPFDDEVDKMVVEFHHGQFLLCLYGECGYMAEYGWEEEGNYGCFEAEPLSSYGDDIEVIGNIHDNPKLLEGTNGN